MVVWKSYGAEGNFEQSTRKRKSELMRSEAYEEIGFGYYFFLAEFCNAMPKSRINLWLRTILRMLWKRSTEPLRR